MARSTPVGNVITQPGGGGAEENSGQAHAPNDPRALTFAPGSPVWSTDPKGRALPIASGERKDQVSNARRGKG
jgi:hypothetical protein